MIYRVFNTKEEVAAANARWAEARSSAGIKDTCAGTGCPQITAAWDTGRELIDGRVACSVPSSFSAEFGGVEVELSDVDFVVINLFVI